jgi:hypothetical protein
MHTGRRVCILTEARTYINPRVPCVPLFSMFVSTPTLKSSQKPQQLAPTVGLTRSCFVRAMAFQSTMPIDQLTPHLSKDNEEVNAYVKCLQVMLNAATVVDPLLDRDEHGVKSLTIDRACAGTRPTISLHWRSTAEGMIGKTKTCVTASATKMYVVGLTVGARSMSASTSFLRPTSPTMFP